MRSLPYVCLSLVASQLRTELSLSRGEAARAAADARYQKERQENASVDLVSEDLPQVV